MQHARQRRRRQLMFIVSGFFAVAILGIAAVINPGLNVGVSDQDRERAMKDCNLIAGALYNYHDDTTYAPCGFHGNGSYGWLRGSGAEPTFVTYPTGWAGNLEWFLRENFMADKRWAGPYLSDVHSDPWGRQYVVLSAGYWVKDAANRNIWVLSAGPNGVIETDGADATLQGDDLGFLIK